MKHPLDHAVRLTAPPTTHERAASAGVRPDLEEDARTTAANYFFRRRAAAQNKSGMRHTAERNGARPHGKQGSAAGDIGAGLRRRNTTKEHYNQTSSMRRGVS